MMRTSNQKRKGQEILVAEKPENNTTGEGNTPQPTDTCNNNKQGNVSVRKRKAYSDGQRAQKRSRLDLLDIALYCGLFGKDPNVPEPKTIESCEVQEKRTESSTLLLPRSEVLEFLFPLASAHSSNSETSVSSDKYVALLSPDFGYVSEEEEMTYMVSSLGKTSTIINLLKTAKLRKRKEQEILVPETPENKIPGEGSTPQPTDTCNNHIQGNVSVRKRKAVSDGQRAQKRSRLDLLDIALYCGLFGKDPNVPEPKTIESCEVQEKRTESSTLLLPRSEVLEFLCPLASAHSSNSETSVSSDKYVALLSPDFGYVSEEEEMTYTVSSLGKTSTIINLLKTANLRKRKEQEIPGPETPENKIPGEGNTPQPTDTCNNHIQGNVSVRKRKAVSDGQRAPKRSRMDLLDIALYCGLFGKDPNVPEPKTIESCEVQEKRTESSTLLLPRSEVLEFLCPLASAHSSNSETSVSSDKYVALLSPDFGYVSEEEEMTYTVSSLGKTSTIINLLKTANLRKRKEQEIPGPETPENKIPGEGNTPQPTDTCNNHIQGNVSVRKRKAVSDGQRAPKRSRMDLLDIALYCGLFEKYPNLPEPKTSESCEVSEETTESSTFMRRSSEIRRMLLFWASTSSDPSEKDVRTDNNVAPLSHDFGNVSEEEERIYRVSSSGNTSITDFQAKYQEISLLGQGGFGSVYRGIRRSDGFPIAIKYIEKEDVKRERVMCNGNVYDVIVEVAFMLKSAGLHQHVGQSASVSLLDWYTLENHLVLVMESPLDAMDLEEHTQMKGGFLQELEAKKVLKQLVDAAIDMHSKNIFHRDIKPQNILVHPVCDETRVRVIDFGCGDFSKETAYTSFSGTWAYAPPEWVTSRMYNARPTTVWQLGVLFFLILRGSGHFNTEAFMDHEIEISSWLSEDCRTLLNMCLEIDPMRRATLEELQRHPALTSLSSTN